jgi:nucleoside-diphosphate-sugar epimerase
MPPQIGGAGYIDVRDVARMHVWAAEHPDHSRGQRYLLSNGKAPPQAAADILRARFPERDILVGEPGKGYTPDFWFVRGESSTVSAKAYDALGVKRFIMFDQSVLDTVEAFEKRWPGLAQNFKDKN